MAEQVNPAGSKPKVRISAKVRAFLTFNVEHGLSRAESAEKAGISDNWAYQQMRRPEGLALRSEMLGVLRTGEASRVIFGAAKLAHGAESEHVRMKALEWIADVAGEGPIQRSENLHLHQHQHVIPGLTVIRGAWQPHQIEGQPAAIESKPIINRLGKPSPHPEAHLFPQRQK